MTLGVLADHDALRADVPRARRRAAGGWRSAPRRLRRDRSRRCPPYQPASPSGETISSRSVTRLPSSATTRLTGRYVPSAVGEDACAPRACRRRRRRAGRSRTGRRSTRRARAPRSARARPGRPPGRGPGGRARDARGRRSRRSVRITPASAAPAGRVDLERAARPSGGRPSRGSPARSVRRHSSSWPVGGGVALGALPPARARGRAASRARRGGR